MSGVQENNMSRSVKNAASSNIGLVVIVGVMFFTIIYVLVYLFNQYNSTSLKTVTMLKKPMRVPEDKFTNISEESGLPKLNYINGKEFSYSFWMYIDGDNQENTYQDKFILGRMESSGSIASINKASPRFELDKSSNTLIVNVRSSDSSYAENEKMRIKYVPLQRWVNIVLAVDNNFIQLFMDGELREVKDLTQYTRSDSGESFVLTPVGNIYIGNNGESPSFKGYISKVQAFNYAVTIDHTKVIYKAGPLHRTVLSVIGVNQYGIQNPIYNVNDRDQQIKEQCTA